MFICICTMPVNIQKGSYDKKAPTVFNSSRFFCLDLIGECILCEVSDSAVFTTHNLLKPILQVFCQLDI